MQRHLVANDGRALEHPLVVRREPIDPRREHGLHAGRHFHRRHEPDEPVIAGRAMKRAGLDERADALLEKERVAGRALAQHRGERSQRGIAAEQRLQEGAGGVGGQRVEPQLRVVRLAAPGMTILRAIVHEQRERRRRHAVDQRVEQGLRLGVGPLQILDHDDQRSLARRLEQQLPERVERALAPLRGIERRPRRIVDGQFEEGQDRRRRCAECRVEPGEAGDGPCAPLGRLGPRVEVEQRLEQSADGQVGRRDAIRQAGRLDHAVALRRRPPHQLVTDAGLADAGLADHGDDLAAPAARGLERTRRLRGLRLTADEPAERARARLQPCARAARADQLPDGDGLGEALHAHESERLGVEEAFGQPVRLDRHEDRVRRRRLLHARRQVGGFADGRVVEMQIAADRADEHLAGIEPDTDRQRRPAAAALAEPAHGVLHRERRVACAHRVVLDGDRCPEQRHDAVTHDLVHGAAVAPHGLDHRVEHRIERRPRVLGIARGQQCHRALQIREQDRDVLALALETKGRAARLAEPVIRRVGGGAARAGARQRPAAPRAEPGAGGNRGAAVRAGHWTDAQDGVAAPPGPGRRANVAITSARASSGSTPLACMQGVASSSTRSGSPHSRYFLNWSSNSMPSARANTER